MEFQKSGIKFRNRNFEELFKDGILNWKLNLEIGRLDFGNWELNLEIGILKKYLRWNFKNK